MFDELKEGHKLYRCGNGNTYSANAKSCFFCEHCTDILYDYTNGPYMFICDCEGTDEHDQENAFRDGSCKQFVEEQQEEDKHWQKITM